MKAVFTRTVAAAAAITGMLGAQTALAAGYEKNIMFGARWAGVGGAATGAVKGADSLYFNPAGLAGGKEGQEFSLNFSPTWSQYKAPTTTANTSVESEQTFSPIFGAIYGAKINEKLGFAIGGYTSGGNRVEYNNIRLTGSNIDATLKSDIRLVEVAAGVGYQVMEGLSVGAAWRVGLVNGALTSISRSDLNGDGTPESASQVDLSDLKGTALNGFKIGAQYQTSETWGLGLNIRLPMSFEIEGSSRGTFLVSGLPTPPAPAQGTVIPGTDSKVRSEFPLQVALGGFYDFEPNVWRGYLEYVYTNYGANQNLEIDATVGTTNIPDIALDWKDQHNVRIAGEYLGLGMPIRAGYVWTSQVVPDERARPTFSSPGNGHTLTLGTGTNFMDNTLQFNTALEYSWASGKDIPTNAANGVVGGDYTSNSYTLHLGLAYAF